MPENSPNRNHLYRQHQYAPYVSEERVSEKPPENFIRRMGRRLSRWSDSLVKVALISILILLSTGFYLIALNLFFPGTKKPVPVPQEEKMAVVKIKAPEDIKIPDEKQIIEKVKAPEKIEMKPPVRRPLSKLNSPKTPKMPALQSLSHTELVSMGQASLGKGSFPSLILAYPDPVAYIRQMYSLGAKTLLSVNHRYYEIDLLGNSRLISFRSADFEGFSNYRRVIDDGVWESSKRHALSQLGMPAASCNLLLVVPMNLELKWIGHQTHILQQLGFTPEDVLTIEANFQNAKLKLTRAHLKNGTLQYIPDTKGA